MPKILPSTKHFRLAQRLRQQIGGMNVGDPLPTVLELQQQYNVSQATVTRALDRLRREGLIVRPAGQLRLTVAELSDPARCRVKMIRPDYPSPTFEELSRVIVEAGKQRDWAFEHHSYRKLEGLDLSKSLSDCDAAVLLPTTEVFPPHLLAALKRPRRPVVVIQDPPAGLRVSSVRIDDEAIGRLAVEHLAALGHRRILLFLSEPPAPSGSLRAKGWRDAMTALGESDLEELVVDPQLEPFDNSLLRSFDYLRQWMDRPHPPFTAIFCAMWTGAVAALRALREKGIAVPGDVSVAAHGGEGYIGPFLFPSLTAIETDIPRYGQVVVETLERQLAYPKDVQHVVVPSQLVVRNSTGQPA